MLTGIDSYSAFYLTSKLPILNRIVIATGICILPLLKKCLTSEIDFISLTTSYTQYMLTKSNL